MKVLRALAGIVAGVALCASAVAQNTTLTVNGQTASDNSTVVDVVAGTRMRVEIENTSNALRPFGLFAALAEDGSNTGWYLTASGADKPLPIFTGVSTAKVEADYGVDIFPDRAGSPYIKLDANGRVVINFNVPAGLSGTVYLQAVVLPRLQTL